MKLTTRDGFILDATFHKGTNSKAVVFAHGMTVDKENEEPFMQASKKLNKLGFSTLLFDFRAHGKSTGDSKGDFTIFGELIDVSTCFDFIKKQGINWVGLAGASFGGSISSLFAGANSNLVQKLVLIYPVLDYKNNLLDCEAPWTKKYFSDVFNKLNKNGFIKVGSRDFKMGKQVFKEMKNYSPIGALKTYKKPILVIHGDKDSYVKMQTIKNLVEPIPNAKFEIIKNAEHGLSDKPYCTQTVDLIVKFFNS
ncbi:lysophospholipase [Patescibacteria group bacterium]|nr:lysophospholipase [Patescibacteria group bacterium]